MKSCLLLPKAPSLSLNPFSEKNPRDGHKSKLCGLSLLKAKWLTIKNFIESQFPGRWTCATVKFHLQPPSSLMATLSTCLLLLGLKQLPAGVDFKPDIKQVPSLLDLSVRKYHYPSVQTLCATTVTLKSFFSINATISLNQLKFQRQSIITVPARPCWMKGPERGEISAILTFPVWSFDPSQ